MDHVTSLNCGHQRAYCSSPSWYISMENHGGMMMSKEENSWFVLQNSLEILPAETPGSKQEELAKGMRIQHCEVFLFILASVFLHTVKSYDMGPPALLPVGRKVSSGFLSTLQIHSLGRIWTREPWVQCLVLCHKCYSSRDRPMLDCSSVSDTKKVSRCWLNDGLRERREVWEEGEWVTFNKAAEDTGRQGFKVSVCFKLNHCGSVANTWSHTSVTCDGRWQTDNTRDRVVGFIPKPAGPKQWLGREG
jgi:hypothetical protein